VAWVSWVHQAGDRRDHKVVLVRVGSLGLFLQAGIKDSSLPARLALVIHAVRH
jgi:hypothetical protein